LIPKVADIYIPTEPAGNRNVELCVGWEAIQLIHYGLPETSRPTLAVNGLVYALISSEATWMHLAVPVPG